MTNENRIQEGQNIITADQGHDIQMGCYRLNTLLKLADRLIDSLPIQETEADRETAEDARMVIQSARLVLHQITNVIEEVEDFGRSDKPSDL